jgi:hypothetical protein
MGKNSGGRFKYMFYIGGFILAVIAVIGVLTKLGII